MLSSPRRPLFAARRRRRAPLALATMAALALVASVGPSVSMAAGQEPEPAPAPVAPTVPTPADEEPPPVGPRPELAPALAGVEVTSPTYDRAVTARDRAQDGLVGAADRELTKGTEIILLTAREEALTTRIARARSRAEEWEADVERLTGSLRDVVASSYMSGAGTGVDPLQGLDTAAFDDRAKTDVAVSSLARRQVDELETARRGARRTRNEERISTAIRVGVRAGIVDAQAAREGAIADKERLSVELVRSIGEVDDESRLAQVDGADFPLVVLDAYWKAADAMRVLAPTCGIEWWALAGIGRVESSHGTFGGAEVRPDGTLTKRIIGIPLTGGNGTAFIGDSDGGLIDGDPVVDRAAGPMQFIPQTWARWGGDGNADDVRDIQNIYDAAAGAAAYLCASGPLTDDAGLNRAYFSYNHSLDYVANVLAGAKRDAAAVVIPPVGS